jgi:hypothetical protein
MRHEAIFNLYQNAFNVDDSTGVFDVQGNQIDIDEELVQVEITRLQAEYEAKQYQRQRVSAYPSIQEQLDLLYWDKINGTDNWEQAIAAVKAEYPKG